jgi:hypothetical protein
MMQSRWRARGRLFAAALALSAVAAMAGYVAGRVQAWNAVRESRTELQVAVEEHRRAFDKTAAEHRGEIDQLRAKLDAEKRTGARFARLATLHEGLRQTHRALRALDARNFGLANDALHSARSSLAPITPSVGGLPEVVDKIERLNVEVADNVGAQRQALSMILDALDPLVGRERDAVAGATMARAPAL